MPPKGSSKKAAKRDADDAGDEVQEANRAAIRKALILGFHKAQQSTSSHSTQRKIILELLQKEFDVTLEILAAVCVKTLSMQQSPDVAKRHAFFLSDLCKSHVSASNNDRLPLQLIESVLPYHGAREKTVRFAVCCLLEPLLKTLKPDADSNERIILFDKIVDAMKVRCFDNFAAVRERAVAALATFQEGKKDCDVTQCLLAVACEDSNVAVRRQVISTALSKEVYFGPMFCMTRDTAIVVRKAAWDSLSKAKFTHVVAFCQLLKQDFINLVHAGLHDPAVCVTLSVNAALTKWLQRDMQSNPVQMLSKVALPANESPAVAAFANALYTAAIKTRDAAAGPLVFPLVTTGLSPANVVMWKVCCEATVKHGGAAEATVLPPLLEFSAVIRDAIDAFILQDKAECRVVTFVNVDHADHILRILLSMFPIYEEGGYLAQTDDHTRAALVKNLSSLLKIVTDTEPGLYAEDTIRALRLIGERHAAQVETTVNDVLQLLFKILTLPRMYGLGYDDIESFGRKDQDRRDELHTLKSQRGPNSATEERITALTESIETDTLYLLRMMHVVHQYLSFCKRGDKVPLYCSHVIQLGRFQCDLQVRGLALRALGMQCLMAPQMVHTFLPLILGDFYGGQDATDEAAALNSNPISQAALMVIFDLLTEYPPTFFETGAGSSYSAAAAAQAALQDDLSAVPLADRARHRAAAEEFIATEDAAKVGSNRLLLAARRALLASDHTLRRIALRGFTKLLSCGRVPQFAVEEVIAFMMVGLFTFDAVATSHSSRKGQSDIAGAFVYRHVDHFFASFAGSDPRRMRAVADGGLLALRMILTRQAQATPPPPATRLLRKVVLYSDAAFLSVVREVDPDFVSAALQDHRDRDAEADGHNVAGGDDDDSRSKRGGPRSSVGTSASSAMSNRLWTVLSRHSLHEHVAEELLLEIAQQRGVLGSQKVCAAELGRLRFYARDRLFSSNLQELVTLAKNATADPDVVQVIQSFAAGIDVVVNSQASGAPTDDGASSPDSAGRLSTARPSGGGAGIQQQLLRRDETVSRLLEVVGPHLIAEGSLRQQRLSAATATSARSSKAHRTEGNAVAAGDETPVEDIVNLLPPRRGGGRR